MGLFNRKKDEDFEEDEEIIERPRKIRDLNPENKRARKEPLKPWGKKERLLVLIVLLGTVLTSGMLALSARNFKLPKLARIQIPDLSDLNPFKEQVITIGTKGNKVSQEKIENTKKLFKEATDNYSGLYAFYIYDLDGDYYYGENYKEKMQAASLIKLPVMYMAMKLDQYKPLVEAMGKKSDNSAYIKVRDSLGKENINNITKEIGMTHTDESDNSTTPEDVGLFFKKLYKNELLDELKSRELENYMTNTIFENWLKPGIPENIVLVHKYGREASVVNDAGIVISNHPFVLVIMSDGVIESEADKLFPQLSKLLYNEHINEISN